MEPTYEKTDDGQLQVVSSTVDTQQYALADLKARRETLAQDRIDTEAMQKEAIADIDSQIANLDVLIAQATKLGLT